MEITLSQEESGIKLFIRGIKWMEIVNALKDESVKVDCYDIMVNQEYILIDGGANDPFLELSLSEIICPLGKIKENIVLLNPLEKIENVDEIMLKESKDPWLETEGLSVQEIWKKYLERGLRQEPNKVKLGNEDIYIESFHLFMLEDCSYCITFQGKEKLINFLNQAALNITPTSKEELINATQEGKPYATEGLRAAFEEAGNISRTQNFSSLQDAISSEPKEVLQLALNIGHGSFKLFIPGINWNVFSKALGEEIVDVFYLSFYTPEDFLMGDDYFEIGDESLRFRRRKIRFTELVTRVTALNLPENSVGPIITDIGNNKFEMKFTVMDSCFFTFWQKDDLVNFLDGMSEIIPQLVVTELINALNEGKPYCTEGLMQDFERDSNFQRTEWLVDLIKDHWIPEEEEVFKKELAIVTNGLPSQPGSEPPVSERARNPANEALFVYHRLLRGDINCFDGEGNIYGFNGEMVIRNVITLYEENMSKEYRHINIKTHETERSKEYIENMHALLEKYITKFRFYA